MTDVGAYTSSPSSYGTFDQGGNVDEWNETKVTSSTRGIRGGGWGSNSYYLEASAYFWAPPTDESAFGFRVGSAVPEPSALVLTIAAFATLLTVLRKSVPHNRV